MQTNKHFYLSCFKQQIEKIKSIEIKKVAEKFNKDLVLITQERYQNQKRSINKRYSYKALYEKSTNNLAQISQINKYILPFYYQNQQDSYSDQMNFEDLNLSCISKKNSMTDLSNLQVSEWKYSNCLRLNDNSNKENILEEVCQNIRRESTSNRKSSRKSSYNEQSPLNELQEKNKLLEQVNYNNLQKLQMLDRENEQLRQQVQIKEVKKTRSLVNNPQKSILLQTQPEVNIQKQNSKLQNIPESESEETPVNRPTLKGYQRNTISFTQYSADQENFDGGYKKKKKSEQKIKSLLKNGDLGSSVRRLFTSTAANNTPLTATAPNINLSNRNSIGTALSDSKYDSITPKIDSNIEKKRYHEEIIRKNKQKFNNFQSFLNSSITQNDSNDITMISMASGQNSNVKPSLFNNDDTLSKISCYEDFNHIFNAPNQNQNVKLKYYSYLLEESFFQHEKFTQHVSQQINKENVDISNFQSNNSKQNNRLMENIEKQSKEIESLKGELIQYKQKSEQLSQLVLLYKDQIIQMNNNNEIMSNQIKEIQDELSTIDIFFQFEDDLDLIHLRDLQLISSLQAVPQSFQSGVERIKENVRSLQDRISQMDRIIKENQSSYNKQLEILNEKLENQLQTRYQYNNKQQSQFHNNGYINKDKNLQNIYEILSQNVERTIQMMENLEIEAKKQKENVNKCKLEKDSIKRHYEQINNTQKNEFDEILVRLQEQFKKLKNQQIRLEEEIFEVKLDKKKIIYQKLGKKLECKLMHSSKSVEEELLSSLRVFEQQLDNQGEKKINPQQSNEGPINLESKIEIIEEDKLNPSELQCFNAVNLSRSLYLIVNSQHENMLEYKRVLLEFMKLFEWLEICLDVDSQGNLKINQSYLTEIKLPQLVEWANIFKKNIEISIQQHIKRQVDSKANLCQNDRNRLKKLIYSGNYSSYFSLLIKQLTSCAISTPHTPSKLAQNKIQR